MSFRVSDIIGDPVTVINALAKDVTLGVGSMAGAAKGSLYRIYTGTPEKEQTLKKTKKK